MNPTHLDFKPNNYENGFDPTQPTSTLEPNTPLLRHPNMYELHYISLDEG